MTDSAPPNAERRGALWIVAALLLMFAIVSWTAVSGKSSTYDEPVHALGSWLVLHRGDFRIDPENPPLWQHWAGLGNGGDDLHIDLNSPGFARVLKDPEYEYRLTIDWLYHVPGNDGEHFIRNSRRMMLVIALALGAVIAIWSWRLGGAFSAVVATFLFAMDPNLLGHAPLVKNDVAMAAAMTWAMLATWQVGQRMTTARGLSLALALAVPVTIKFSGVFVFPLAAMLLIVRALLPAPWMVMGHPYVTKARKLGASAVLLAASLAIAYLTIWACYHFRFDPTPQQGTRLSTDEIAKRMQRQHMSPGAAIHLARMLESHRMLPQAFVYEFLYQLVTTQQREGFLLGERSDTGWWYYFPLAMLFKTPVATLLAIFAAALAAALRLRRKRTTVDGLWAMLCLGVPFVCYLAASMDSHLNIGLRHVFPLYALMYVAVGVVAAQLRRQHPSTVLWSSLVLCGLLAIETLSAFPDFIAFFNFASGGSRGGLALLSDSNLDWGQDLPLLAKWQHEHPGTPMYVLYFGSVDPRAYGMTLTPPAPDQAAVLAISATSLQGIYADPNMLRRIAYVRKHQPFAILGGTIYLYRWTPADNLAMEQQEQTP